MERYESYKDSGVKWLGEIPGHWEVRKMKYVFKERSQKGFPKLPLLAATQLYGVIKKDDYENRTVIATKGLETLKLVCKNDFVISLRSFEGGIEMSHEEGIISPAYTILTPQTIEPSYFRHLGKSPIFINLLKMMVTGIREGQNIDYNKLKTNLIPLPPKSEQTAIANYLDSVTSKIDEAISQQQKMIDLLNERKQIIIQNAVTKGLDPNVKMKDSGVEWIGEIPEHWGISSVKRISSIILGKMLENAIDGKGFPYLCAKDVHKYNIDFSSLKKMFFREKEKNKYAVKKGDLLVVEGGAAGSSALVNIEVQNVYIQNSLMIVRCNKSIMKNEYLCYLLNSMVSRGYSESICNKATIMHFTKEKLGETVITVPPIIEQTAIANYLDSVTSKIDSSISQCNKMISLLQERKQIIINDVVTGKVKVV